MILVRNAFDIDAVLRGLNIGLQGIAAGVEMTGLRGCWLIGRFPGGGRRDGRIVLEGRENLVRTVSGNCTTVNCLRY